MSSVHLIAGMPGFLDPLRGSCTAAVCAQGLWSSLTTCPAHLHLISCTTLHIDGNHFEGNSDMSGGSNRILDIFKNKINSHDIFLSINESTCCSHRFKLNLIVGKLLHNIKRIIITYLR